MSQGSIYINDRICLVSPILTCFSSKLKVPLQGKDGISSQTCWDLTANSFKTALLMSKTKHCQYNIYICMCLHTYIHTYTYIYIDTFRYQMAAIFPCMFTTMRRESGAAAAKLRSSWDARDTSAAVLVSQPIWVWSCRHWKLMEAACGSPGDRNSHRRWFPGIALHNCTVWFRTLAAQLHTSDVEPGG